MEINRAECHPEMDYDEHEKSYSLFLKGFMYLTVFVAALMVFLLFTTV